jgi:FlaA1/EpsC-like NDP-sugar epimerase
MRRYFMIPSEAAILVLQAGAMGNGGEVFVLDMGEPVSILDLAKEMIQIAGYEPDKDIPIVFTQPFQGEKLFEDILSAEEGTIATKHQRIFMAKIEASKIGMRLDNAISQLQDVINQGNIKYAIEILSELVPNFRCAGNYNKPDIYQMVINGEQLRDYQMQSIQGRFNFSEGHIDGN